MKDFQEAFAEFKGQLRGNFFEIRPAAEMGFNFAMKQCEKEIRDLKKEVENLKTKLEAQRIVLKTKESSQNQEETQKNCECCLQTRKELTKMVTEFAERWEKYMDNNPRVASNHK